MNILFLSRRFYPDIGGVEKHIMEISKILVKSGHRVTVITQSKGLNGNINGINVQRITSSTKKIQIWKEILINRDLIQKADIVHAHDVYFWYFPFRFLYPRKKSYITFHGYETYPIKKKAIIVRKISELMANGNIIVGEFMKKWYKTNPTFIIYGGVDIPKKTINPISLKSAIFFGRLDEHTGILDYSKAVDIIKKKYPDFKYLVVGDGKYKPKLKKFNLKTFDSKATDYLKEYNFAFVSRYLSILEAIANKRLVIAVYDNPIKEDYLKMTPYKDIIIIANSPDEIAEKVDYCLRNPKFIEKKIVSAYKWVKNNTWEDVVEIYLKLWYSFSKHKP